MGDLRVDKGLGVNEDGYAAGPVISDGDDVQVRGGNTSLVAPRLRRDSEGQQVVSMTSC